MCIRDSINTLDNIRISLYGLDQSETFKTSKHAKAYEVVKQNLTNYNKRKDRTLVYLNYVLLPENINNLETILEYIMDIGGADSISLREDHSFRYNVDDRNKLQDALLKFDERVKKYYRIEVDYGYGLQNAMAGIDTPLVQVTHKELNYTQAPQVKVCVDPHGDIFSYMDAGFVGRHGVKRYCLGNVTNSSLEKQLKKMKKIKPQKQDPTYLDAYNHLIQRYIYEQTK